MSYVASATQYVSTAACNFLLKRAGLGQSPLLCSVLPPAVQTAGNYIYSTSVQKTSNVPDDYSHSSSLSPLEEAGAGLFGAFAGSHALNSVGTDHYNLYLKNGDHSAAGRILDIQTNPLVHAAWATIGSKVTTYIARAVKETYLSQTSAPANGRSDQSQRSHTVRTQA